MRIISSAVPLRILLIEDSRGDAILIEKALCAAMPEMHTVERVVKLSDALKVITEQEFDVALLDRSLPDVEEFSGLHSIQSMAPKLPIVFLTALKDELTAFEAIAQGAQDYLFKDRLDGHVIKRAIQYAVLRKQFEGMLIVQANYDMLTGLANRMLFESRLDMALAKMKRYKKNIAVLFLDLDRFKQVNDTMGHLAGDLLLKEVGNYLKKILRPYDTAARFGGDEFAILLEEIPKTEHSEIVAQKIIQLFDRPFEISGAIIDVGVSIGITTCTPDQNVSREGIVLQADKAMYAAKSIIGNIYKVYSNIHQEKSRMRSI